MWSFHLSTYRSLGTPICFQDHVLMFFESMLIISSWGPCLYLVLYLSTNALISQLLSFSLPFKSTSGTADSGQKKLLTFNSLNWQCLFFSLSWVLKLQNSHHSLHFPLTSLLSSGKLSDTSSNKLSQLYPSTILFPSLPAPPVWCRGYPKS